MAEVEVTPPELKFRFALNKQLLATITINNKADQKVAFKIKTTAPKKYVVRPSSGIMEPKTSLSVQVIMQAQKDYPTDFQNCKDKFMVQTTVLAADEQIDRDTFTKELRKDLRESRLRVVMEGPPAPPSPVPEANEGDADAHAATVTDSARAIPAATATNASAKGDGVSDTTALKSQLDTLLKERDDLRKKLDYVELQGSRAATQKVSTKPAVDPALKFRVTIVHIILVAIVAFLIGHYT